MTGSDFRLRHTDLSLPVRANQEAEFIPTPPYKAARRKWFWKWFGSADDDRLFYASSKKGNLQWLLALGAWRVDRTWCGKRSPLETHIAPPPLRRACLWAPPYGLLPISSRWRPASGAPVTVFSPAVPAALTNAALPPCLDARIGVVFLGSIFKALSPHPDPMP